MTELKPNQLECARLLASGCTQEVAGKAVSVTRKTVSRWLEIREFQDLVRNLKNSRFEKAVTQVREEEEDIVKCLVQKALKAVQDVLDDPDSRCSDKLKAAALVASWTRLEEGLLTKKSQDVSVADPESRQRKIDDLMRRRTLIQQQLEHRSRI